MGISPAARRWAEQAHASNLAALKADYRDKLERIREAFTPPLRSSELSLGLDLGERDVGRFVSDSPRLARAVPDRFTRGVIDAVMRGDLLIAAHDGAADDRRQVVVCARHEVPRLAGWQVVSMTGDLSPPPRRDDWDDAGLWSDFGAASEAAPEPEAPSRPDARPAPQRAPRTDGPPATPRARRTDVERPFGFPIGFGAMRLSTIEQRPSEDDAIALIHLALDGGVRLLDTADVYSLGEADIGHNERLVAKAVATWAGDCDAVTIATKGGLTRPNGGWKPNGRPKHLKKACDASLKALGVDRIDLYQLHVVDPKVPLADSVGALVELQQAGKIRDIGLCNVHVYQVREAQELAAIASVQLGLSPSEQARFGDGTVAWCLEAGIPVIAHSPVGGHRGVAKVARNRALGEVGERHHRTQLEVALAWLVDYDPLIVPIPGATRPESLRSSLRAATMTLSDDDRAVLDARLKKAAAWRGRPYTLDLPKRPDAAGGEVVLIMGFPAAGKSTRVAAYTERGYDRLNRDLAGGKLAGLLPKLDAGLSAGRRRWVLDNTYPTAASRRAVLEVAARHGVAVSVDWLDTSLEDAQINAARRMIQRYGKLLSPDEMAAIAKRDPNMFPPLAQFGYRRRFEAPRLREGFARVDRIPFERTWGAEYVHRGLLLDFDGTLRKTKSGAVAPDSPDDVEILPGRAEVLARYRDAGWKLLGVSNQGGVAGGQVTEEAARAAFDRTCELLGVDIDVVYCPHEAGMPRCWCRKPMPGMGVRHIETHRLDPARSLMVGDMTSDRTFAERLGIPFAEADAFFADPPGP